MAPKYGSRRHGVWSPETKSWSELSGRAPRPRNAGRERELFEQALRRQGFTDDQVANIKQDQMSSAVGPVDKDGGQFLDFLKAFRRIIEGDLDVGAQIDAIRALVKSNTKYQRYDQVLGPDIAATWFIDILAAKLKVGKGVAKALFGAGFKTPTSVRAATHAELKSIKGVGASALQKLRKSPA